MNLNALCTEIQEYLASRGIVVFQSFPRAGESSPSVYWDTDRCPDYHPFLAAAEAAGVRLVTLYARTLEEEAVDEALEQLAGSSLDREERRAMETRLKEIRGYAGFTCQIELSFDLAQRIYIFDLHTEWWDDLNDLIDEIDDSYHVSGDGGEEPLGGDFFSRN